MNTNERVLYLISWAASVPQTQLCPTTNIKDDLNLDSIDFMLLIVKLEKWFDIVLSEEEVESIETVNDATACVLSKSAA